MIRESSLFFSAIQISSTNSMRLNTHSSTNGIRLNTHKLYVLNIMSLVIAILLLSAASIEASPILPVHYEQLEYDHVSTDSNQGQLGWSRQDVFTLVSVCVAIAGILIGALLASPILREWLCKPVHRKANPAYAPSRDSSDSNALPPGCAIAVRRRKSRREDDVRRQLQEEYDEYLSFREFRAMRSSWR
jgi:hypothetical protein